MKNFLKNESGNWWLGWVIILIVGFFIVTLLLSEPDKDKKKKENNKTKTYYEKATPVAFKKPIKRSTKKVSAKKLLRSAPVATEVRDGYSRDSFKHWSDLDRNGCDTRDDVLAEESLIKTDCKSLSGRWFSPYDRVATTDPSTFDIDHMVPLAEAWDSGARRFSASKRELYANDSYPRSLIAVTAGSNRSKSDRDPAEWLPENKSYVCRYLTDWILVKYRWRLNYDRAEKTAVANGLKNCSPKALTVKKPNVVK